MIDLRNLLITAGLTAAIADELLALYERVGDDQMLEVLRGETIGDKPDVAKREARLMWWAGDHIPREYKRLLDAQVRRPEDAGIEEATLVYNPIEVWNDALQQFVQAGMVDTEIARVSVNRAWTEAWRHRFDKAWLQGQPVDDQLPADLPAPEVWPDLLKDHEHEQDANHPIHILRVYLDALWGDSNGSQ